MEVISVRERPEYKDKAVSFLQQSWPEVYPVIYQDCIDNCIKTESVLPQWYLLEKGGRIIGCAGLITNDFISRMDLCPWVCAVFISADQRGSNYGEVLIEKAKEDSIRFGFKNLNLCTDHIGYYEKFGFEYIGNGYHPWEEESRIYQLKL